jgi:hypothetical protein
MVGAPSPKVRALSCSGPLDSAFDQLAPVHQGIACKGQKIASFFRPCFAKLRPNLKRQINVGESFYRLKRRRNRGICD